MGAAATDDTGRVARRDRPRCERGRGPYALLVAAGVLGACGGAPSTGVVSADLRASLYQDSNDTTIGSSTLAVRAHPTEQVSLAARYLLDVTTSASVDVVSAATHRWDEARHEAMGGAGWSDGSTSLDVSYVHSIENDWESHTVSAGGSIDFEEHNYTLQYGGSYVYNDVWRAHDANFRRRQDDASGTLALVIVGSPSDLWSIGYSFAWVGGYQESPYRYARLTDPTGAGLRLTTPEQVPEDRFRHALTVRWNHLLQPGTALRSHARLYADDWGIASITLGTEVRARVDDTDLGLTLRCYGQLGVSFWHDVYPARQSFMSSDRELSPFVDVFGGPFVAWRVAHDGPFASLHFELRATAFYFHFFEFARLPDRAGVVAELALGGSL